MDTPFSGIFNQVTDLIGGIVSSTLGAVSQVLPPEVTTAIGKTVGTILDPANGSINAGDPQPSGPPPIPVEPGTPEMDATQASLAHIITLLNDVVDLAGWAIPDQYKVYIKDLIEALTTIQGWL